MLRDLRRLSHLRLWMHGLSILKPSRLITRLAMPAGLLCLRGEFDSPGRNRAACLGFHPLVDAVVVFTLSLAVSLQISLLSLSTARMA